MKKLDFFKYAAVLAAFCLLFVAGCGDDDEGGNSSGLPALPNATGGEITEGNYEDGYDNQIITTKSEVKNYLLPAFENAIRRDYENYWSSEEKAVRSQAAKKRFFEKRKNYARATRDSESDSERFESKYGDGYMTVDWTESWTENGNSYSESGTVLTKAYDYSYDGILFVGGAMAIADYYRETESRNGRIVSYSGSGETKMNGKYEFRGKYKGSISVKNVHGKGTYSYKYNEDTYEEIEDNENMTITGEIVIKSGSNEFTFKSSDPDFEEILFALY